MFATTNKQIKRIFLKDTILIRFFNYQTEFSQNQ